MTRKRNKSKQNADLCVELHAYLRQSTMRQVLIMSGGEGSNTDLAMQLAYACACTGASTLLMETGCEQGVLLDRAVKARLLTAFTPKDNRYFYHTRYPALTIMAAAAPVRPEEWNEQAEAHFQEYEWVIMDAHMAPQGLYWASRAQGTVLTVPYNDVSQDKLAGVLATLERLQVNVLGAALVEVPSFGPLNEYKRLKALL